MKDSMNRTKITFNSTLYLRHTCAVGKVGADRPHMFANALEAGDLAREWVILALFGDPIVPVFRLGEEGAVHQHYSDVMVTYQPLCECQAKLLQGMCHQIDAAFTEVVMGRRPWRADAIHYQNPPMFMTVSNDRLKLFSDRLRQNGLLQKAVGL